MNFALAYANITGKIIYHSLRFGWKASKLAFSVSWKLTGFSINGISKINEMRLQKKFKRPASIVLFIYSAYD